MNLRQIIKGIIFCIIDETMGPVGKNWTNLSLSNQILDIIAKTTLQPQARQKGNVAKIEIVPFPVCEMKGIVTVMEWSNPKISSRKSYASITLLFENENDPIFYKYFSEFELPFQLLRDNIRRKEIQSSIEEFENNCMVFLNQLAEKEARQLKSEEILNEQETTANGLEYCYKLIIIGDPEVGKTSTVLRFTDKTFYLNYIPTIGANITEKIVRLHNCTIKLLIWDIAGQARFQRLRTQLYHGSDGVMFVYDLTKRETFIDVEKWHEDLASNIHLSPKIKLVVCGNKKDKENAIEVSSEEGRALANKLNADFFEISALTNLNIQEIFNRFAEHAISLDEKRVEKISL